MAPGFTPENLLYLLAVHEEGSESAAAVRLGVGQATISRKLRALSDATDTDLTVRTAQGMRLTEAGARLLPHARQVRSSLQAARREIRAHNDETLELAVGITPHLVPRLAGALSQMLLTPSIRAEYTEASSAQLVDALRNNRLSVAFTISHANLLEIGYESMQLGEEEIVLIGPPTHAAFRAATSEKALLEAPLFFPPEGSTVSRAAATHFTSLGHDNALITHLASPSAVRAATLSGAGLGITVRSFAQAEVTAGWLAMRPLLAPVLVPVFLLTSERLRAHDRERVLERVAGLF